MVSPEFGTDQICLIAGYNNAIRWYFSHNKEHEIRRMGNHGFITAVFNIFNHETFHAWICSVRTGFAGCLHKVRWLAIWKRSCDKMPKSRFTINRECTIQNGWELASFAQTSTGFHDFEGINDTLSCGANPGASDKVYRRRWFSRFIFKFHFWKRAAVCSVFTENILALFQEHFHYTYAFSKPRLAGQLCAACTERPR